MQVFPQYVLRSYFLCRLATSGYSIVFTYCLSQYFLQSNASFTLRGCGFSTQAALDLPVGGMIDIPLAQTGEGIAECELLKWFVQEVSERFL